MKQLVALTHPDAILVSFQIGATKAKSWESFLSNENPYWHDPESFGRMWDQVEKETGTKWPRKAQLKT